MLQFGGDIFATSLASILNHMTKKKKNNKPFSSSSLRQDEYKNESILILVWKKDKAKKVMVSVAVVRKLSETLKR